MTLGRSAVSVEVTNCKKRTAVTLNALFLLVVMAPVLSADFYSATDCGQPGSALYAECQAPFPPIVDTAAPDITTLGYIAGKPPQVGGMPGWFYIPLGASPDGAWVAYVPMEESKNL